MSRLGFPEQKAISCRGVVYMFSPVHIPLEYLFTAIGGGRPTDVTVPWYTQTSAYYRRKK